MNNKEGITASYDEMIYYCMKRLPKKSKKNVAVVILFERVDGEYTYKEAGFSLQEMPKKGKYILKYDMKQKKIDLNRIP